MRISQHGSVFLDEHGREVLLRGVNLGGDSKVPYPNGGTHFYSDFADHRTVSFVGRPFPLQEAEEHFRRLRHWGFNLVRLLTTWEAIEHAGPLMYDEQYLDYYREIVRIAGSFGLYVLVDFHQDAWSRMTGGDGAPGWLFEALGLDLTKFHAAGAAHIFQAKYDYKDPRPRQSAYPQMSWGANYRLPANGILWTLFWAGAKLTPEYRVAGRNVQEFLHHHYFGAMETVARYLADQEHVIGFDLLNEPGTGWIGEGLTYRHTGPTEENPEPARVGPALSPLDCLAVARGLPVKVPLLGRDHARAICIASETTVNPDGVSIWTRDCPFEAAGVYGIEGDQIQPLRPKFFRVHDGDNIDLSDDCYGPFFHRGAATIRAHRPDWSVFLELDPYGAATGRPFPATVPERSVNAGHWYDIAILYRKSFDPNNHVDALSGTLESTAADIRKRYIRQIGTFVGRRSPGEDRPNEFPAAPQLLGEFGIPYDLHFGEAYRQFAAGKRDGIWDLHARALSLAYDAVDALRIHATQWNYSASNRNDLRIGDGWNQEDLSIFSRDQQEDPDDPDSGGRAVHGFCRPCMHRAQGRLRSQHFDSVTRRAEFTIEANASIPAPTVIYAPRLQYGPAGPIIEVDSTAAKSASVEYKNQFVYVRTFEDGFVRIVLCGAT